MITAQMRHHLLSQVCEQELSPTDVTILVPVHNAKDPVNLLLDLGMPSSQCRSFSRFDGSLHMKRNVLDVVVFVKHVSDRWKVCLKDAERIAVAVLDDSFHLSHEKGSIQLAT